MSSLTDVFLRHYREVLGFLAMRTGSRDVAQDCAQDTWIKLAEFQDKTLPDNDRAYVFRVAANIATDWHRRRRLRPHGRRYCRLCSDRTELAR